MTRAEATEIIHERNRRLESLSHQKQPRMPTMTYLSHTGILLADNVRLAKEVAESKKLADMAHDLAQ